MIFKILLGEDSQTHQLNFKKLNFLQKLTFSKSICGACFILNRRRLFFNFLNLRTRRSKSLKKIFCPFAKGDKVLINLFVSFGIFFTRKSSILRNLLEFMKLHEIPISLYLRSKFEKLVIVRKIIFEQSLKMHDLSFSKILRSNFEKRLIVKI